MINFNKNTYNYENGEIIFDYTIIDTVYQLSNYMREYAYSENHLSNLFVESLEIASNENAPVPANISSIAIKLSQD